MSLNGCEKIVTRDSRENERPLPVEGTNLGNATRKHDREIFADDQQELNVVSGKKIVVQSGKAEKSGRSSGKDPSHFELTCKDAEDGEAEGELSEANVSADNDEANGKSKGSKERKRALSLIDTLLSLLMIGPSVIGFWRGIWVLMDLHEDAFPTWPTLVWGLGVHIVFTLFREQFSNFCAKTHNDKSLAKRLAYQAVRIFYIYLFGVACNAQWRSGWIILDEVFRDDVWIIVSLMLLLLLILAILRSLRNVLAPPFTIAVDEPGYIFQFPTRYNVNTRDWSLYLLDCAFSVGVVGTLVVFVWRGVWILFDLYLFPEDQEYSAVGSLAIGYVIVAVTFCLQPLMRYVCARLEGLARLIAADAFLLLSFLGTVNVWRGIWNVLDLWLLPDNPELSCWITHVGCFVFLVLLNCSNSILVRGVYIDAEEDEGKCVVFPCHYLRLFFKIEREKKEARRRNLLVASRDLGARTDGSEKDTENGALLSNSTTATIIPASPESLV